MAVTPSLIGLWASGILILIALILVLVHWRQLDFKNAIYLTLLFAIVIGIHSLQHFAEQEKGYDPLKKLE